MPLSVMPLQGNNSDYNDVINNNSDYNVINKRLYESVVIIINTF